MSQCPYTNLLGLDTYVKGMPYQDLAKIREAGSLVWIEDPENGVPYWAAVKRDSLDFISQNPDLFSSAEQGPFPMEMDESEKEQQEMMMEHFIISMDPPKHMKYRKVVRDAFTPRAVKAMEPWLRECAKKIIDRVASKGECEFVEDVDAELPLMAILEVLGVPQEDRKQFFEWTNIMAFADDPDVATSRDEAQHVSFEVLLYAAELAKKQRANPTSQVVEALLNGEVDGNKISEEMFAWMFILIMVGGNESTRTATAHGMRLLMENPDQLQHLVDHPEDIPDAVEEMLRYNPAFVGMQRQVMEDVEVCGVQMKQGDKMILHWHTINMDDELFSEPLKFDIARGQNMDLHREHRAFGIGTHFCLGAHLARLELQIMFEEIIPRMRNPKIAKPVEYVRDHFVNGIKSMHITFDAA